MYLHQSTLTRIIIVIILVISGGVRQIQILLDIFPSACDVIWKSIPYFISHKNRFALQTQTIERKKKNEWQIQF